ncbi:PQQ-binding-like beta-propeller repeat protein [Streptomyces sp. NPDC057654]|uniref:outer membrane protein assembly factor BamB family protein n=1 Tax=Streptomyces sp. NPDC057654 TaxID=3346196 RepID=UPI003697DBD7
MLLAIAVLVLCACVGCAVWLLPGRSHPAADADKSAAPKAGTMAWAAEARTKPSEGSNTALGTWFTDSLVIKAEPDMVTAYDIKRGEKKWSFVLSGPLCAASREADGNRVVIATLFGKVCTDVTAIGLRTGERPWEQSIAAEEKAGPALTPAKWRKAPLAIALHGGYAYLSWATGEESRSLVDGKRVSQQKHKACEMVDAAGGPELIATAYCGGTSTIRSLDPRSLNKPKWSTPAAKGTFASSVIATRPVTVMTSRDTGGTASFGVFDPATGHRRTNIAANDFWQLGSCFLTATGCTGALVEGDTLYVGGKGMGMAYSLTDGKSRWTYKSDANRKTFPVTVSGDDDKVAFYVLPSSERPGRLSYVSVKTGSTVRTITHADTARARESTMQTHGGTALRVVDDRLLMVDVNDIPTETTDMILAMAD